MRALTIALCLLATPALADVTGPAKVIDGDSLEVAGEQVRLHGIDAPESRQLCFIETPRFVWCWLYNPHFTGFASACLAQINLAGASIIATWSSLPVFRNVAT